VKDVFARCGAVRWIQEKIMLPAARLKEELAEDARCYDRTNKCEAPVLAAHRFSCYRGRLVVKTNFKASFSLGVIGLSRRQNNALSLRHEYGHALQLQALGVIRYLGKVAIPSLTINILDRLKLLKYDYYGAPFEAAADRMGGAERTCQNTPWPKGVYNSWFDLLKMLRR